MSATISIPVLSSSGGALIASPDICVREQVLHRLNGRCRPVQQATGGADALAKLESGDWQVLFLDRRLPDLEAEEVMAISQRRFPRVQVVLLDVDDESGKSENDPGNIDQRPRNEVPTTGTAASPSRNFDPLPGIIGSSPAMQQVYRLVRLVASRPTTVLIMGETGTGKELIARAVHELSPRSPRPLVIVNCAAIPDALLESELFGFARGAFTGAVQSQLGRIAAAHGGTLFLDEISELPLGMQAKLLRFLELKEVQRLGSCESTRVDVRVLAASNTNLAQQAAKGRFRLDLFYRLSAFPIELPPLVQRRSDILPLAEHFLASMAASMEMATPKLSPEAVRRLEANSWRGNVRELQHVIERASILVADGNTIEAEHLYFPDTQTFVSGD
jgi:transcriptional regulator with GAF, ATPase, and Fis domain